MTIDLAELKEGANKTAVIAAATFRIEHYRCKKGDHILNPNEIIRKGIRIMCPIHKCFLGIVKNLGHEKYTTDEVSGELGLCLKPNKKCNLKWAGTFFKEEIRIFCLAETPCWRKPP